jgi:predicted lactoylglutathione lyase
MPNITCITLGSKDLPRSRRFYQALGFKAGFNSPEVVFFQLNSSVLALYDQSLQSKDLKLKAAPRPGGVTLAVNLGSKRAVDRAFAKARRAGAKAIRAPHEAVWGGYTSYFSDPDGHAWELAWNPFWKLDKKGAVKLK